MKLEIGGGPNCPEDWYNLDVRYGRPPVDKFSASDVNVWRAIVEESVPYFDESFDQARASHVLEHVKTEDRIFVMNEVWRVLKPGALFDIIVPRFPHPNAIADPGHVSYWVERSFVYFNGSEWDPEEYGARQWDQMWLESDEAEIRACLRKPWKNGMVGT